MALNTVLPESIQSVDTSAVSSMLAAVNELLASFTDPRVRQLLMISSSKR